eukprot:MONOS_2699.1-p1 / transcript=MONOS_2699.1 / gene=MONOS_2699 / organism=Monocercomonoides_exilis_PA203 / gene_product= Clathrin heavy chain A / transcript_product= Clathrin heavy chain A / location=Mono_scaffold00057:11535-18612(-) / protein_length=2194 / sequence_SO=supercontig / SO=protein_coding / is_pseudo=false
MDTPLRVQQLIDLKTIGLDSSSISLNTTHLLSDHRIFCQTDIDGKKQIIVLDPHNPMGKSQMTMKADSICPHPSCPLLAVKGGNMIQIFDIEKTTRIKKVTMEEDVEFMSWADDITLAIVTNDSVYHLSINDQDSPKEIFRRIPELADNKILNYQIDPSKQWCLLHGSIFDPETKTMKGNTQIWNCTKRKKQYFSSNYSMLITFPADFTDEPITMLCLVKDGMLYLNKISEGESLRMSVEIEQGSPQDVPVSMSFVSKFGFVFVLTVQNRVSVVDASSAARVATFPLTAARMLFSSAADSANEGIVAVDSAGIVFHLSLDRRALLASLARSQSHIVHAAALSIRAQLHGAEELCEEAFEKCFGEREWRIASKIVVKSPNGALRTLHTLQRFHSAEQMVLREKEKEEREKEKAKRRRKHDEKSKKRRHGKKGGDDDESDSSRSRSDDSSDDESKDDDKSDSERPAVTLTAAESPLKNLFAALVESGKLNEVESAFFVPVMLSASRGVQEMAKQLKEGLYTPTEQMGDAVLTFSAPSSSSSSSASSSSSSTSASSNASAIPAAAAALAVAIFTEARCPQRVITFLTDRGEYGAVATFAAEQMRLHLSQPDLAQTLLRVCQAKPDDSVGFAQILVNTPIEKVEEKEDEKEDDKKRSSKSRSRDKREKDKEKGDDEKSSQASLPTPASVLPAHTTPLMQPSLALDVFFSLSLFKQATSFIFDVIAKNVHDQMTVQTHYLDVMIKARPDIASQMIQRGGCSAFNRPRIAKMAEAASLFALAASLHSQPKYIARCVVSAAPDLGVEETAQLIIRAHVRVEQEQKKAEEDEKEEGEKENAADDSSSTKEKGEYEAFDSEKEKEKEKSKEKGNSVACECMTQLLMSKATLPMCGEIGRILCLPGSGVVAVKEILAVMEEYGNTRPADNTIFSFLLGIADVKGADPSLLSAFVRAAVKTRHPQDATRALMNVPLSEPKEMLAFLEQNCTDPAPIVALCTVHAMFDDLARVLALRGDFESLASVCIANPTLSPPPAPAIACAMVDCHVIDDDILAFLASPAGKGALCPVAPLTEGFEKRGKLALLRSWLEARIKEEGKEDPATHSALAMLCAEDCAASKRDVGIAISASGDNLPEFSFHDPFVVRATERDDFFELLSTTRVSAAKASSAVTAPIASQAASLTSLTPSESFLLGSSSALARLFDPLAVGKLCEERSLPRLACCIYRSKNCSDALIAAARKAELARALAEYAVEQMDSSVWSEAIDESEEESSESAEKGKKEGVSFKARVVDEVLNNVLPTTTDKNMIANAVKAFLVVGLANRMVPVLEAILLPSSSSSASASSSASKSLVHHPSSSITIRSDKTLQNLLLVCAIRAESPKVLDYVKLLNNYDASDVAKHAMRAQMYEVAYAVLTKAGLFEKAVMLLLNEMDNIDRAEELAKECNTRECWAPVARALLEKGLAERAVDAFCAINDASEHKRVVPLCKQLGLHAVLAKYLRMARPLGNRELDTELLCTLARADLLAELEETVTTPTAADIPAAAETCFEEKLYLAARILFSATNNYSRLAITLLRLHEYPAAVDAARRARHIPTWREVCVACLGAKEFRLAQIAGVPLALKGGQELANVITMYRSRGLFSEIVALLDGATQQGSNKQDELLTHLGIVFAQHFPERLMRHIELHHHLLLEPPLRKACELNEEWAELRVLEMLKTNYDDAVEVMLLHPEAWDDQSARNACQHVENKELIYRCIDFYARYHPKLLDSFADCVKEIADKAGKGVGFLQRDEKRKRKAKKDKDDPFARPVLPLVLLNPSIASHPCQAHIGNELPSTFSLSDVVSQDIAIPSSSSSSSSSSFGEYLTQPCPHFALNEALNELFVEEEDVASLLKSVCTHTAYDQLALARQLELHHLLMFRRIAAVIFAANGRFSHAISILCADHLIGDAIRVAAASKDRSLADQMLHFIADEMDSDRKAGNEEKSEKGSSLEIIKDRHFVVESDAALTKLQRESCFGAMLYECYDLIPLSTVLDVAWNSKLNEMSLPFLVQSARSSEDERQAQQTEMQTMRQTVNALVQVVFRGAVPNEAMLLGETQSREEESDDESDESEAPEMEEGDISKPVELQKESSMSALLLKSNEAEKQSERHGRRKEKEKEKMKGFYNEGAEEAGETLLAVLGMKKRTSDGEGSGDKEKDGKKSGDRKKEKHHKH